MRPDPRPVQPRTVLAVSRTPSAGSAGDTAVAVASLTAAALGAVPEAGRDEGMVVSDRTKGCCYRPEPNLLTMTNLLNLTHITDLIYPGRQANQYGFYFGNVRFYVPNVGFDSRQPRFHPGIMGSRVATGKGS